jgi:hypothetical protein
LVEHEGGRFRRNHLVPPPDVDSLDELNEKIAEIEKAEDARRCIHPSLTTVAFNFAAEADLLRPLPAEDFEYGLVLHPKVSPSSRVTVRQCRYSVPARFIGGRVRVVLRASDLLVFHGRTVIATHPRLTRRGDYHDILDHYLEILLVKPGAMPGSTALAQARRDGVFTPTHDAFWAAARTHLGQAEGTRALIEVLLLHRRMDHEAVLAGLAAANRAGAPSPEVVAIEARKAAAAARDAQPFRLTEGDLVDTVVIPACLPDTDAGQPVDAGAKVISLRPRPVTPLPPDTRPVPSLTRYNQLLPLHRKDGA